MSTPTEETERDKELKRIRAERQKAEKAAGVEAASQPKVNPEGEKTAQKQQAQALEEIHAKREMAEKQALAIKELTEKLDKRYLEIERDWSLPDNLDRLRQEKLAARAAYEKAQKNNFPDIEQIRLTYEEALKKELKEIESFLLEKSQPNAAEAVPVSSPNVETPSQPVEEPNNATLEPVKKSIEELEKEIKSLEELIKATFRSYNPPLFADPSAAVAFVSSDLSDYRQLSEQSSQRKKIMAESKQKGEDFYEPALAYKEALEAQLKEIKSKVPEQSASSEATATRPVMPEQETPSQASEEPNSVFEVFKKDLKSVFEGFKKDLKDDLKTVGFLISDSLLGRGVQRIGGWIGRGLKAIGRAITERGRSKLGEKNADQSLSGASVEMVLVEKLSETNKAIEQIREKLSTIPLNETSNDNPTLFSHPYSPSAEPRVDKEAVDQQKGELEKLQAESDHLSTILFDSPKEELRDKLDKPDVDFRKLSREYWAKKGAYKDLIKSNDPKNLQKIYAAGLEYEKALRAEIAKKNEYIEAGKPSSKLS